MPDGFDAAKIEALLLKYSFRNLMLLVEALSHASYALSGTICSKMSFLGGHLLEILIAEALWRRADFHLAASSLGTTKDGSMHGDDCDKSVRVRSAAHLLEWISACCNHATYAYACVSMKLHKFILCKSASLKQAVKSFACFVRHTRRSPEHVLPELMKHDAPQVLGDVFQAVVAAVFLDSSWMQLQKTFMPILEEHLFSMVLTPSAVTDSGDPETWVDPVSTAKRLFDITVERRTVTNTSIKEIGQAQADAHERKVFHKPLPPSLLNEDIADACAKQVEAAFKLTDFHIYEAVEGDGTCDNSSHATMGTSPRAAQRRCAFFAFADPGRGMDTKQPCFVPDSDSDSAMVVRGDLLLQPLQPAL